MAVRILDRSLSGLPRSVRTLIDWTLTITLAAVAVLIFQAEVAKPYRIPTSSMEPTLHCAKPADGCKSRVSDRVIANRLVYRFHKPERGDIIVPGHHPRSRLPAALVGRSSNASWGCPARRSRCGRDACSSTAPDLPSPTFGLLTAVRRAAVGDPARATGTSSWVTTERCPVTRAAGASFPATTSSAGPN